MPTKKPSASSVDKLPPSLHSRTFEPLRDLAIALHDAGLPDQVVASWLSPIFLHLGPVAPDTAIPEEIANLAALVGVTFAPPAQPE